MGERKEDWNRLFPVVPGDRTRENRHKLKYKKFQLNVRKNFLNVKEWITYTDYEFSILRKTQNLTRHSPEQPALADPDLRLGLD